MRKEVCPEEMARAFVRHFGLAIPIGRVGDERPDRSYAEARAARAFHEGKKQSVRKALDSLGKKPVKGGEV